MRPRLGFNGATTLRPWKAVRPLPADGEWPSFNGATTLRPWKVAVSAVFDRSRICFNGATTLRPWKVVGITQSDHGLSRCFNGATTLRPWKVVSGRRIRSQIRLLQWGHDLAAVEGLPPGCSAADID